MRMKKNKRNVVGILLTLCITFSSLTAFADDTEKSDYTLYQYSQSEGMIQVFEKNKPKLLENYKKYFPNESGWWDEYAIMPIETGVISGYPDGTIRPNNPVTGGEFAKMVATSFFTDIKSGGTVDNAEWEGKWYNNYYNAIAKAFPYFHSYYATVEFMESPMKRSEVAYVLAKIIDSEKLDTYIEKIINRDYSSMSEYTDFSMHLFSEYTPQNNEDKYYPYRGEYDWDVAEKLRSKRNIIPNNQMAAIMMLKDIGVMVGDGEGHISPNGNVTRAEIFKLLNETCKATREWFGDKFFGWENFGRDFFDEGNIFSLDWKYTLDTVINPEAEKEQQYTFGDLDWENVHDLNPYELVEWMETGEGAEILNEYYEWSDSIINTEAYGSSLSEDLINYIQAIPARRLVDSYIRSKCAMSGVHNVYLDSELWQIPLGKEFEARLLDEVLNSVTLENDIIKVYIPPFKSKYHEIRVSYESENMQEYSTTLTSTLNDGWNEIKFNKDASVYNQLTITTQGKYGGGLNENDILIDYVSNEIYDRTTGTVKEISR